MIVALVSEKESHAVYFLHQQNMSRLDAVQYISHGISKSNESCLLYTSPSPRD